jgi:lysyl endopeptidase
MAREPSVFTRICMYKKSRTRVVTTLATAAIFAAINANMNWAVAANAEGRERGRVGIDFVESYTPTNAEPQYVSPFKPYDEATAVRPQAITLAAMPTHELTKKKSAHKIGGPTIISVPRQVVDTDTVAKTADRMQWVTTAQGNRIGSIRIKSTDAKGVFIGVLVEQLPKEAMLRFHGDGSGIAFHVSATEILARLQTNNDAGDMSDFGRTYWAPNFDSSDVTMEIELLADVSRDKVRISIPIISHVFTTAAELDRDAKNLAKTGAGTCNVDATCYPEYDNESRSVARILYMPSPGNGAYCTGNLVNNKRSDGTPYFLTAHHCIFTQTQASNILQLDWLYRTSACNSGVQSTPPYQTTGGAVLLHSEPQLDMAFLRLNNPPPSAARFAAWTTELVNVGEAALGLHNPLGGLQEASLGAVTEYLDCYTSSPGATPNCNVATPATGNHIMAKWTAGSTIFGSSGSGLFVTKNSNRYLVGQLHLGNLCSGAFSSTIGGYGRFDLAYKAALYQWLSPDPQYKPFDIDANGSVEAVTDGVLMTRYMLGLRGDALIAGVLGSGATRNTATLVTQHLQTLSAQMDVDGDGTTRASTDALLILRYMRKGRGSARTLNQIQDSLSTATGMPL